MAASVLGSNTQHWPENLTPSKITPKEANGIILKGGGFINGEMKTVKSAESLGMEAIDTGKGKRLLKPKQHLQTIDAHLHSGGLVCAHVHYRRVDKNNKKKDGYDWAGDHWVLITSKNVEGEYHYIDPGDGRRSIFSISQGISNPIFSNKADNVILYGKKKLKSERTQTSSNRENYEVVRYILLKSA